MDKYDVITFDVPRTSETSSSSDNQRIRSLPATHTSLTTIISSRLSETLLNKTVSRKERHGKRVEDRNWSWGYLRKRCEGDLENLYQKYILRVQIAYFNSYLIVQAILSLLFIILVVLSNYNVETGSFNLGETIPEVVHQLILFGMSFILYFFLGNESKFHKYPFLNLLTSVVVVSFVHLLDIGVLVYYYLFDESQSVRNLSTFALLIVLYFFLPIQDKRESAVLGILISLTSVVSKNIIHYFKDRDGYESNDWKSMAAVDCIYYLCANVIGLYAQFLREINMRRAFIDKRRCLKSTIKNNIEKDKEEHLLQCVLPKHIAENVKAELLSALQLTKLRQKFTIGGSDIIDHDNVDGGRAPQQKASFSEIFVERHNDTSILFADIVNFTVLAGKLKADELVGCLNALYGRFDSAAKENDCLRIKLLGDCYYCISSEARNCVELGFEMIEIIRSVRDKYEVDVAMRIGIHTGNILSGLLGMYKWQYDIWSKDVTIANCMESAGEKHKIHISKATKDFLGSKYEYVPGNGQDRNPYLKENNIETFFVVPNRINVIYEENDTEGDYLQVTTKGNNNGGCPSPNPSIRTRRGSVVSCYNDSTVDVPRNSIEKRPNSSAFDLVGTQKELIQIYSELDAKMDKAIDDMSFNQANQCCSRKRNIAEKLSPIFMNFERISLEKEFQCQSDPLFKYYVTCALFALACQGATMFFSDSVENALWISYTCAFIFMAVLTLVLWTPFLWETYKDPKRDNATVPTKPTLSFIKIPYRFSISVTKSCILRVLLYLVISQLISTIAIIDAVACTKELDNRRKIPECSVPWYFTYSCALALLVMYIFFRVHFLLKVAVAIFSLFGYGYIITQHSSFVFDNQNEGLPGFSAENRAMYSHIAYLISIALLLHVMDRQMDYINRLNFLWKNKLKEKNDEAIVTHEINTILIHNILPLEIANIYLDSSRVGQGYSRGYKNVSVLFATVPKFMDSFSDHDISGHGYFLQILNEIIVEFDQALMEFVDIEKIKVVGSTYMAACGLEVHGTGRLSHASGQTRSSNEDNNLSSFTDGFENAPNMAKRTRTLITLVKFAASMMARLDVVNKDAFQNFQLRVGITCGKLVAGVIGAEKPMYDIWGDVVNLASRMDSTGIAGKIQVNEESATLLMQSGVKCDCRGTIPVKGKGLLKTYFVPLSTDYQLIPMC